MMRRSGEIAEIIRLKLADWLRQGVSPGKLALTLVLGFVIGCIPLIGLPTALCAILALVFRLNQPAIQVANYAAMPLQIALLVPFVKLGGKLVPMSAQTGLDGVALLHPSMGLSLRSPQTVVWELGGLAGQALVAWLLLAIPVVLLLTPTLALLLRRVPALAAKPSELQG